MIIYPGAKEYWRKSTGDLYSAYVDDNSYARMYYLVPPNHPLIADNVRVQLLVSDQDRLLYRIYPHSDWLTYRYALDRVVSDLITIRLGDASVPTTFDKPLEALRHNGRWYTSVPQSMKHKKLFADNAVIGPLNKLP